VNSDRVNNDGPLVNNDAVCYFAEINLCCSVSRVVVIFVSFDSHVLTTNQISFCKLHD
jgi:hypothetical protein